MRLTVPRKRVVPGRSASAPAWGRRREDTSPRSNPPYGNGRQRQKGDRVNENRGFLPISEAFLRGDREQTEREQEPVVVERQKF